MKLHENIQQLELFIHFNGSNYIYNNNQDIWCHSLQLYIEYDTF